MGGVRLGGACAALDRAWAAAALSTTEACGIMYLGADGEFDRAFFDAFFGQVVVRSERDSGPASAKAA